MIATRRGLLVLLAVAVLLAMFVIGDARRSTGVVDRTLAQGLDVDTITALRWTRPGAPTVHLGREGERWSWLEPVAAPADQGAVANILATLRAARWHRRAPAATAGPVRSTLTVSTPTPTSGGKPPEYADHPRRTFGLGRVLEGSEQAWLVDGEHALLVDAWVARALDPDPLSLMIRRPFETAAQAPAITIRTASARVRLEGTPRWRSEPTPLLVRAELVTALEQALAALEIVVLPEAPRPAPADADVLTIELPSVRATLGGECGNPEVVLLTSSSGTGCVRREAAAAVRAAFAGLTGPDTQIIDLRPAPLDAATITLRDATVLDVARLRVGGGPGDPAADPARVVELLAVLAAPAPSVPFDPKARPNATITITDRTGSSIRLELLAGGVVHRAGEPLALALTPANAALLARTAKDLRVRTLWLEDPLAISSITVDTMVFRRGSVIGEWLAGPVAAPTAPVAVTASRAQVLDALAGQLAHPQAVAFDPPAFATSHRVVLDIAPPGGAPVQHVLELGGKQKLGCPARADGSSVVLPAAVCDAIASVVR